MSNKKVIGILAIVLLLSFGVYFSYFLKNHKETNNKNLDQVSEKEKDLNEDPNLISNNEYYIVYIKQDGDSGSSFVPLTLNPGLENDSNYRISISFDDDGEIVNGDRIIVIDNFLISDDNRKMIKEIAGNSQYDEALKEIQERVNETKENLQKEGLYNQ